MVSVTSNKADYVLIYNVERKFIFPLGIFSSVCMHICSLLTCSDYDFYVRAHTSGCGVAGKSAHVWFDDQDCWHLLMNYIPV